LLNLILNAVEAMGSVEARARELLISTEQDRTGVLVAVRDSGPGIEHLERVFEAFYSTKSSGTGMGLSICRSVIEAHGGKLWTAANEPCGAVFQFTLPDVKRELTGSQANRRARSATSSTLAPDKLSLSRSGTAQGGRHGSRWRISAGTKRATGIAVDEL
jgi:hypothetical protein